MKNSEMETMFFENQFSKGDKIKANGLAVKEQANISIKHVCHLAKFYFLGFA